MHNSQAGTYDQTLMGVSLSDGPYAALTKGDCIICHTGINAGTGNRTNNIPYINSTTDPDYDGTTYDGTTGKTLAGGNFYYVSAVGDACGHNVYGVAAEDATIGNTPPGFDIGRAAEDGTTPALGSAGNWASNQLTCAGTYGCHGTHAEGTDNWGAISGGHHSGVSGAITDPGTGAAATAPKGYRFLVGIAGYEDPDHEYQPTASTHNQYKGVDSPGGLDESTISYLCAECHGNFHDGTSNIGSSSPWLRHPTDFDMGNKGATTEYRGYGGGGDSPAYMVATPVASVDVSAVKSTVAWTDDSTIVTCLSCHRAHASPYYKIIRWDYAGSNIGGKCSNCHTTKD